MCEHADDPTFLCAPPRNASVDFRAYRRTSSSSDLTLISDLCRHAGSSRQCSVSSLLDSLPNESLLTNRWSRPCVMRSTPSLIASRRAASFAARCVRCVEIAWPSCLTGHKAPLCVTTTGPGFFAIRSIHSENRQSRTQRFDRCMFAKHYHSPNKISRVSISENSPNRVFLARGSRTADQEPAN